MEELQEKPSNSSKKPNQQPGLDFVVGNGKGARAILGSIQRFQTLRFSVSAASLDLSFVVLTYFAGVRHRS